ncbi:transporter substrate-binding domain-containing protein [Candidatus Halocynthiibacter alkanivorans]|jgi:polar amino acid transport system substrate-binding protein|uniref:transporter substrate-binding domain-containing protein n=1 Tax=Candidatus Halocynthiibacter alkanivorans TaxID=2267619 RepID=UPI000DF2CDDB|nr:transporter substrate-binding domain-containing protein [Candidatus Halocynthiibacter alkanivorans]
MNGLINKVSTALVLTGALLAPLASQAGEVLDKIMRDGKLTMATDSALPPISFLNQDNVMDGFDVEVGKEVARRMGVELKIVTPEWAVITAGNWNGRWDISVGSMTPTEARAKKLDFPAVYYYTPAAFFVHEDSEIQSKEELNGKMIGVPTATSYESYMRGDLVLDAGGVPDFTYEVQAGKIKTMSLSTALMDDLRLGAGVRLDGMLYAMPGIMDAINSGYPFRVVGDPVFYEPLAIATEKGDAELNAKIVEIIESMRADGTLTSLSNKWFGVDYTSF